MKRARRWGAAAAGLALLGIVALVAAGRSTPSPPGPEPGRSVYVAHCATCHGGDGRGRAWWPRVLLLEPGDLAAPAARALPDTYLFDVIRHGGSSFGKPGMPSFGFVLADAEIRALMAYVRALPELAGAGPAPGLAR